jgi:hypothetical protein
VALEVDEEGFDVFAPDGAQSAWHALCGEVVAELVTALA